MSTRSKVNRQVKRNMREHPTLRARRLVRARSQRWIATRKTGARIHAEHGERLRAPAVEAYRAAFARITQDATLVFSPDTAIVTVDTPGGAFEEYQRHLKWAQGEMERSLMGAP